MVATRGSSGIGHRLGDAGETAYLELVKSEEQKEQERQARIAAAGAQGRRAEGRQAREEGPRRRRQGRVDSLAISRKRGSRKGGEGAAPAKRRGKTGVKTG